MEVKCPYCKSVSQFEESVSLIEVACESCGSSFDLDSIVSALKGSGEAAKGKLGRFELMERLGTGSNGTVWRALDPELERDVAVKIPIESKLDETAMEKFMREARSAAQLKHGNIVGVHEVGREGDTVYIVTDFIEGITLADWLKDRRLTPEEAAQMAARIADALHYAHEKGVIHRDMKPANIMVDSAGEPHLMDFGLAKRPKVDGKLTEAGQVLGTPAYMSPEQAGGEAHTAGRTADVYSLGVILYEMLTGERPFRGQNLTVLLDEIIHHVPELPDTPEEKVPPDLESICLKALEKSPEMRFGTAADFSKALNGFLAGEKFAASPAASTPTAAKGDPGVSATKTRFGFRLKAALVAAAICIAIGSFAFLASNSDPEEVGQPAETPLPSSSDDENLARPRIAKPVEWNMDLRNHLDAILKNSLDSSSGQGLYTDISEAILNRRKASWVVGWGMTHDGMACRISVDADGQWNTSFLTPEEAREEGYSAHSVTTNSRVPPMSVIQLVELRDPEIQIESFRGSRTIRGRLQSEILAEAEVRNLGLTLIVNFDEGESRGTKSFYHAIEQKTLPSGELTFEFDANAEPGVEYRFDKPVFLQLEGFVLSGDPRRRYLSERVRVAVSGGSIF